MQRSLDNNLEPKSVSLYLHIPFCRHRCSYCDFNTYTSVGSLKDAYSASLCKEIKQVGEAAVQDGVKLSVRTIYFGGGTPSLISPVSYVQILSAVRSSFKLLEDAEISMEANPGTVNAEYLLAIRALGINRLSFGVQSVVPTELALLEREHDFETVIDAVQMSRTAGFDDINLDLIYGVPGQTMASWEKSLRTVWELEPAHFSLYCLTIEPGTPMQRWLNNGRIEPSDPDLAADQYQFACEFLAEKGFRHYEISNWASPGKECRHNITYWRNQTYLGLGAGAHGYAGGYRYHVVKQPRVYIRRMQNEEPSDFPISAAVIEKHTISKEEAMSDTVITQLRLLDEGLDLDAFQSRFGQSLDQAYDGLVSRLIDWGMLEQHANRLCLSERGRFLSNQVFYRFM